MDPRFRSSDDPDGQFVGLIEDGDQEAAARLLYGHFGSALVRAIAPLALSLGGADEAEAVANWAVNRAVVKGRDFDRGRGTLERWLHTIGRSRALSLLRRVKASRDLRDSWADRSEEVDFGSSARGAGAIRQSSRANVGGK